MSEQNFADFTLWNADNLDVMRGMNSETVDLVYLDPPFNSKRMYQGKPGSKAAGQSFADTWSWNDAKEEWLDSMQDDYPAVFEAIEAARDCHTPGMGGYIAFMAVRLVEIRRVLKPTGAMYLHCDMSSDSYLRVVCDAIFGKDNLRNTISWCYPPTGGGPGVGFHRKHDTILYYGKSHKGTFNRPYTEMTAATRATYSAVDEDGRLYSKAHGKRTYLDQVKGRPVPDWWTDIKAGSHMSSQERTGWATQKPVSLLERIINATTNPGDLVLDPFCGCATAMVAAQNLERRWIGIDKEHYAIEQVKERLGLWCNFETTAPVRNDGDADVALAPIPVRWQRDPYGWEKFTNAQKRDLLAEIQRKDSGVQCPACGVVLPLRYFQLDHVAPRTDPRSTNMIDNRVLLCQPCNGYKSNNLTLQGLIHENTKNGYLADGISKSHLDRLLVNISVGVENLKAANP